ncbi:MAG: alpha/beta fold hydrolase [Myxococcales bacterium]|nr:alpha/beta fold hydrolase [Myxococcales bacterium]
MTPEPVVHLIEVPGGRIAVAERGAGAPVALLPGCGRPATDLDRVAEALADAGYRALSIDHRGVGQSQGFYPHPTLGAMADDVIAVLDALGIDRADLVGHALGNRVARAIATAHGERVGKVVLLAAGGQAEPEVNAPEVWRAVFFLPRDDPKRVAAIAEGFFAPGNDPTVWLDWWPQAAMMQMTASAATAEEDWWLGGEAQLFVVQGALDRMAPPANAQALARDAADRTRVVTIEGAGHELITERTPEVVAAVLEGLTAPPPDPPPPSAVRRGLMGGDEFISLLESRTLQKHAGFFADVLKPGMRVLDLGCGPGGITRGIADAVAPGEVVGVDPVDGLLRRALLGRGERPRLHYLQASAYALPFADARFDAALLHTVLMHLERPVDALREVRRVLRPGGLVAVCDGDWGADLRAPTLPMLDQGDQVSIRGARAQGMDIYFGRKHKAVLRRAGFVDPQVSLGAEIWSTPEETRGMGDLVAKMITTEAKRMKAPPEPFLVNMVTQAWRAWGAHPDAFFARTRCEAIAWRRD